MIRVAIVDDADIICQILEKFLASFSKNNYIKVEFDSYYSGDEIIKKLGSIYYDLIFLDIEIGEKNGIDVSSYLRNSLKNKTTEIIYVSSHSKYAIDLFDYDPITFLTKPIDSTKLSEAFKKFLKRLHINEEVFAFKSGKELYRIPLKDVLYFESNDHKIILFSIDGKYEFYDKMERLVSLLESKKFLNTHKSYLVNSKHIQKFEYESVTLTNHTVIPISQSKRKSVREWQLQNDIEEAGWIF